MVFDRLIISIDGTHGCFTKHTALVANGESIRGARNIVNMEKKN